MLLHLVWTFMNINICSWPSELAELVKYCMLILEMVGSNPFILLWSDWYTNRAEMHLWDFSYPLHQNKRTEAGQESEHFIKMSEMLQLYIIYGKRYTLRQWYSNFRYISPAEVYLVQLWWHFELYKAPLAVHIPAVEKHCPKGS